MFDMFGFQVEGHPNLRRILCHEASRGTRCARTTTRRGAGSAPRRTFTSRSSSTFDLPPPDEDDIFERMTVNIGPSHPAMHGTFRLMAVLDGERIVDCDVEIGYLHRCFEKMCGDAHLAPGHPVHRPPQLRSSFINNVGYAARWSGCSGIEAPPKAVWARTILSEFSRIMDHCVCNGTTLVDYGRADQLLVPTSSRARRSTVCSSPASAPG